jgi:hypothetical protein
MNFRIIILTILAALFPQIVSAGSGPGHVSGPITNITSFTGGLLLRIGSNEVPQNCTSGHVWMRIHEENKSMIALTIASWTLGRNVVVYTSAGNSGYCNITQVDPAES